MCRPRLLSKPAGRRGMQPPLASTVAVRPKLFRRQQKPDLVNFTPAQNTNKPYNV